MDDTTLMAESEEKLNNLLMRVKEESEKVHLKLNIKKTKIMASGPITSWDIEGEKGEAVTEYLFLSIIIREIQIKTILGSHCISRRMKVKIDTTKCW